MKIDEKRGKKIASDGFAISKEISDLLAKHVFGNSREANKRADGDKMASAELALANSLAIIYSLQSMDNAHKTIRLVALMQLIFSRCNEIEDSIRAATPDDKVH
jgi:hypothetical protein